MSILELGQNRLRTVINGIQDDVERQARRLFTNLEMGPQEISVTEEIFVDIELTQY